MTDSDALAKLEGAIAEKKGQIAALEAELAELETAYRVLQRLNGATPSPLIGKTILESAIQILSEHNDGPVHYRDLADQARARGYAGRQSDPARIRRSFWDTLIKLARDENSPVVFTGRGMFRLRRSQTHTGED